MRSLFAAVVPEADAAADEAKRAQKAGAEAPRSPTRGQRARRRSAPRTLQEEADTYHEMAQQANRLQSRQLRSAAARRLGAELTGAGAGEQLPMALGVVRELEDRLRALEGAIEGAGAAAGGGGHTARAIARLLESHERWRSEDEVLQRELDSMCACQAQVTALLAKALERPAALATSGGAAPAAAAASAVAALPALVQSCIDSLSGGGAGTADDAWFKEESAFLQGVAPLVPAELLPSSSRTGMAMSSEAAAAILHQEEEADDAGLGKLLVKLEVMGQRFIVEEEGRQVFDWANATGRGPGSSSSLLAGGLEGAGAGESQSPRRRGPSGRTLLSGGLSEEPPGAEGSISPKRTKRRPKAGDGAGPKSPRKERQRPGALDLSAAGALAPEGGALPEPPSLLEDAAVSAAFAGLDAHAAAGGRSALAQLEVQSRCLQEDVAALRRRLRAPAAARAPSAGDGSPRWLLACPRPPAEGAAGAGAAARQAAPPPAPGPAAALRAELADAWALLAERGESRREAEALRRDCRRAEEELAALRGRVSSPGSSPAPLSRSPTYARLHDGRQVELTSKVQQQAAELEELRRRLSAKATS